MRTRGSNIAEFMSWFVVLINYISFLSLKLIVEFSKDTAQERNLAYKHCSTAGASTVVP